MSKTILVDEAVYTCNDKIPFISHSKRTNEECGIINVERLSAFSKTQNILITFDTEENKVKFQLKYL